MNRKVKLYPVITQIANYMVIDAITDDMLGYSDDAANVEYDEHGYRLAIPIPVEVLNIDDLPQLEKDVWG